MADDDPRTQVIRDAQKRRRRDRVETATFTIVEGPEVGHLFVLDAARRAFRIGRAEDADLRIVAPSVSRHHATVVLSTHGDTSGVRVDDNGSTNGMFVNGRPETSSWLQTGDKLRLGDVLLRFQWMSDEELQYSSGVASRLQAAARDALTGLLTRVFVQERLPGLLAECDRRGWPCCCVMVDLDRFKAVNDRHGHLVGDAVIRRSAHAIQQVLRRTDHAVRYGGEEFLVILPDSSLSAAVEAGQRLADAIAAVPLDDLVVGLRVTASLGIARRLPSEDADQCIARADAALYAAKQSGRARTVVADDPQGGDRPSTPAVTEAAARLVDVTSTETASPSPTLDRDGE